ncbi:exported hypothetical protein [Frankia sp. AgKG'84/4]
MRRLKRSVLRAGARLIASWVNLMTIRGPDGIIIGNLGPLWGFVVCAPVAPAAVESRLCPQVPLSPVERQLEQHFRPA